MTTKTQPQPDQRWTIDELGQAVATALALAQVGQSNGQIREVPNKRTIRYYTSLGLLDGPAEMRGRTAFYGPRHLQQLVAIKRLQQRGLPLREVQTELAGAGNEALAKLADVDVSAAISGPTFHDPKNQKAEARPSRRETAFWEAEPTQAAPTSTPEAESTPKQPEQLSLPGLHPALELEPGVFLVLTQTHTSDASVARPTPDDLEAVRLAAVPLLDVLKQRGLVVRAIVPVERAPEGSVDEGQAPEGKAPEGNQGEER